MNAEDVATQFLNVYYKTFAESKANLPTFYGPESELTWEGNTYKSEAGIAECMQKMSAANIQYVDVGKTVQMLPGNLILILVQGHMRIDGAEPVGFSQVFVLQQTPNQSWYIRNEIFKFNFAS